METYSQLDCLLSECDEAVPSLIGKVRKTRLSKNKMIWPEGYSTVDLIGKWATQDWTRQLKENKDTIQVLDTSKLNEKVDEMVAK